MTSGRSKISWLPGAATALAIVSCYGTVLLIGVLSLLGVSLAIDERIWTGAISTFAALAARYPDAGGVATFVRLSLGPTAARMCG